MHLSITLVNDQLDAQFFYFIIVYYSPLHVSSNVVLNIRRSKFFKTASGMVTICKWPSGVPDSQLQTVTIPDGMVTPCKWPSGAADSHLQTVTIPDAVLIQSDLLMMSTKLLETCR